MIECFIYITYRHESTSWLFDISTLDDLRINILCSEIGVVFSFYFQNNKKKKSLRKSKKVAEIYFVHLKYVLMLLKGMLNWLAWSKWNDNKNTNKRWQILWISIGEFYFVIIWWTNEWYNDVHWGMINTKWKTQKNAISNDTKINKRNSVMSNKKRTRHQNRLYSWWTQRTVNI